MTKTRTKTRMGTMTRRRRSRRATSEKLHKQTLTMMTSEGARKTMQTPKAGAAVRGITMVAMLQKLGKAPPRKKPRLSDFK